MSYKYENIELMPEIFSDLMLKLFSNKQFTREECIGTVTKYHIEHGGKCEKRSYIATFKRSTIQLRQKGYDITNLAYGVWRINKEYNGFTTYYETKNNTNSFIATSEMNEIQETIGSGDETIYVYYYPVYKRYALSKGDECWYCKVGMTKKNYWDRIYSQAGTCFPEEPFVGLIIKCNDAHKLEQTIHNILKMKNKWVETAPGTEWFITSPLEVRKIYESII